MCGVWCAAPSASYDFERASPSSLVKVLTVRLLPSSLGTNGPISRSLTQPTILDGELHNESMIVLAMMRRLGPVAIEAAAAAKMDETSTIQCFLYD